MRWMAFLLQLACRGQQVLRLCVVLHVVRLRLAGLIIFGHVLLLVRLGRRLRLNYVLKGGCPRTVGCGVTRCGWVSSPIMPCIGWFGTWFALQPYMP